MKIDEESRKFLELVAELSGENIFDCAQCGKCSAGCPSVKNMSVLPNMIIRRLQLGQKEKVLNESAIWKCASCMTCWSRCPRKVNLCNIMEALRFIYMTEHKDEGKCRVEKVSKKFLKKAPQQAIVAGFRKFT